MPKLTEPLLLDLIASVYDASLDTERWPEFLARFSNTFSGCSVLFSQDMRRAEASIASFSGFDPTFVDSYIEHFAPKNLWLATAANDPEGTLVVGHERVSAREILKSQFYSDWLRPQKLSDSTGAVLVKRGELLTSLSVIRGREPGPFEQPEIQFWLKLMPHIKRAVMVHRELCELRTGRNAALEVLSRLSVGVVGCSPSAEILFANVVAEKLFRSGGPLMMISRRLAGRTNQATRTLQKAVHNAARVVAGESHELDETLALPTSDGRLAPVMVTPLRIADALAIHNRATSLIFAWDPARKAAPKPTTLRMIYQLTNAEAELAASLCAGLSLAEAAAELDVTIATARTQLRAIFAKTGVTRQAELIRLIMTDPVLSAS